MLTGVTDMTERMREISQMGRKEFFISQNVLLQVYNIRKSKEVKCATIEININSIFIASH